MSAAAASSKKTVSSTAPNNDGFGIFNNFIDKAKELKDLAQKQAEIAGKKANETFLSTAETLGFKDQVDALEKAAAKARADFSKVAGKGAADANKKLNKARRLANRALEFDDDEEDSVDYDLLLSAVGATEKTISIRAKYSQNFHVPAGSAFVWKARLKKGDIGFSICEVRGEESIIEIQENRKYSSDITIQGQLPATSGDRIICLIFDNSYSHLAAKRVAYWIACGENVSLADDAIGAARSVEIAAADEGPTEESQ